MSSWLSKESFVSCGVSDYDSFCSNKIKRKRNPCNYWNFSNICMKTFNVSAKCLNELELNHLISSLLLFFLKARSPINLSQHLFNVRTFLSSKIPPTYPNKLQNKTFVYPWQDVTYPLRWAIMLACLSSLVKEKKSDQHHRLDIKPTMTSTFWGWHILSLKVSISPVPRWLLWSQN